MKRSTQEVIELVVFALIALLLGTLLIWGVGWAFTGLGWLFRLIAGFIWSLLRFIIPIAIVAGVIYLVVRLLGARQAESARRTEPVAPAPSPIDRSVMEPAPAAAPSVPEAEPQVVGDPEVDTHGYREMDEVAEAMAEDSEQAADEDEKRQ